MGLRIMDGLVVDGPALRGLGELGLVEATPARLVARGGDVFLVLEGRFDLGSPAALARSPVDRLTLSRDPAGADSLLRLDRAGLRVGDLPGAPDGPMPGFLRGAVRPAVVGNGDA